LIEAAHGSCRLRDNTIVCILADTGVRAQELCDLNIGDVDFSSGAVVVRESKWRKRRMTMHRNGVDDITLARFMYHTTTEVLKRYLAEDETDLAAANRRGSMLDHA